MGTTVTNDQTSNTDSNIDYDFLGTEYYYANYNPAGGYKACKSVIYHLFLNSDKFHQSPTVNLPQVDINEQILFIHLFIGDTQFNIVNADSIKISFECDGNVVEGDSERLDLYNPYRGTFTYIMNKEETHYTGLNTMTITVTIGDKTVEFTTCYNVVANVTLGNTDGTTYEGMTLQDLIDLIKNHIENSDIHCDDFKNLNINRAFITLDTYEDLTNLDTTKLVNGKMFRVNTDPLSYYQYNSSTAQFEPLVLVNVNDINSYVKQAKNYYEQAAEILTQIQRLKEEMNN